MTVDHRPTPDPSGPWQDAARAAGLLDVSGAGAPTVFAQITALAQEHGAINLGQGFPDYAGPQAVLDAAAEAMASGLNQYAPGRGVPVLLDAIAAHRRRVYDLEVDPASEILVTAGATEAIAASVLALVRPGDEVAVLEPYYDAYAADIGRAGGVQVNVPLRLVDGAWRLDASDLAAITDRTRLIIVNNPHNPTGWVGTTEELSALADAARAHDAIIVADEVYEHLVFDGVHVPMARLAPERTLSVGSAGKTFSVTGWKVGWVTGSAPLIDAVLGMKQWLTFTNGTPLQVGVATGLGLPDQVFDAERSALRRRRDTLCSALSDAGFDVVVPDAGYFVVADAASLGVTDAEAFCLSLPERIGVAAIPVSAFTAPGRKDVASLVRFAYCKRIETIDRAADRLRRL